MSRSASGGMVIAMIVSDYTVCIGGTDMSFRMCGIMHEDRITDAYLDVQYGDAHMIIDSAPHMLAVVIDTGLSHLQQRAVAVTSERQAIINNTKLRGKPGYIYIVATIDKRYKIGRSRNLRRAHEVATAQAIPANVYAIYAVDDMVSEETRLHRAYKPARINSVSGVEWFRLTATDLDAIHAEYKDRCVKHAILCDL